MARKNVSLGKTGTALLAGEIDLSHWSDEELERGQRKDRGGSWRGRPPKVVPKVVYDELIRRKLSKASDLLRENTYDAVAELTRIAKDPEAENRDKLTAIKLILDRVYGKEVLNVNVEVKARWQEAIEASVVSLPAAMAEAIEAQAWDDDEDDRAGQYEDD